MQFAFWEERTTLPAFFSSLGQMEGGGHRKPGTPSFTPPQPFRGRWNGRERRAEVTKRECRAEDTRDPLAQTLFLEGLLESSLKEHVLWGEFMAGSVG